LEKLLKLKLLKAPRASKPNSLNKLNKLKKMRTGAPKSRAAKKEKGSNLTSSRSATGRLKSCRSHQQFARLQLKASS
jgi:hypothetical protein